MGPPDLSDTVSIAAVFYDNTSDIPFLRLDEPSRCKVPRVSVQQCYLLVTLSLCAVHPSFRLA